MTTKTIALYRNLEYNYMIVGETKDSWDNDPNYLRVSEPLEVTFKDLPDDELVKAQVESLQARKSEIRATAELKVQAIDEQISKLMALTYQGGDDE